MNVDRRENRNCYSYRGFGHLARNCRNRKTGINRRMKCEENSYLIGNKSLMDPN